jgi:hypothetical protein
MPSGWCFVGERGGTVLFDSSSLWDVPISAGATSKCSSVTVYFGRLLCTCSGSVVARCMSVEGSIRRQLPIDASCVWLALKVMGLVLPAAAKEPLGCDNTGGSIVFRRRLYDCRQTCCGGFLLLFSKISFSLAMCFFSSYVLSRSQDN